MKSSDWLIVLLVGVLLLILAIPAQKPQSTWNSQESKQEETNQSALEEELKDLLENMQGVGKVKVMITVNDASESLFSQDKQSEIEGVVVLAQGADNARVVSNISSVIMALFDIDAHRIKIVKMSEAEDGR